MRAVVRPLRLTTGIILFTFATSHFIGHAFGVRSVDAMQAASAIFLKPWQTPLGLSILYGAFLIHATLGLRALYRRRHLRIPASEAWQLVLGLAIPLLVIPHAGSIRLGSWLYGLEHGYPRLIYGFFVTSPDIILPRQFLLMGTLWLHGCIGLRAWLRSKPWYGRLSPLLASLATLVPVLAVVGVVNAGLDMREAVRDDPATVARLNLAAPGSQAAEDAAAVGRIVDGLLLFYLGLVVGTFALRAARDQYAKKFRAIRITYPGGRSIAVPAGFSVLEASRWAGIPHASVCGGRGRCSTCRVRVLEGGEQLAEPGPLEAITLARIKAEPDVRLACQIRPAADLVVEPLVPTDQADSLTVDRFTAAAEGGQEVQIAAMFVDLRQSTRLAAGRLPYDALFLFDRYIQAVSGPIHEHGGHVTSIAGDGVMSMFSAESGGVARAAANALKAAAAIWDRLEALNRDLAPELEAPLRVGIGLHTGVAVVGWLRHGGERSLQFLGDVGNVAAKLEQETKRLDCTLVVSLDTAGAVAASLADAAARADVVIGGRSEPLPVVLFRHRADLDIVVSTLR